ncbi:hypothetical protein [Deinococcus aerophilus]|uniref:Uncharacterized protein n=1 Tax=Deinococcus aerophilus TaxID=522488 RepID=A0ABQ2GXW2_9DEIO|nr:hypothetical protein [Deinococcus aerophilus]GGM16372.1 hypothetical protein GCM10010841_25870 [Deinococcus aerophilus]
MTFVDTLRELTRRLPGRVRRQGAWIEVRFFDTWWTACTPNEIVDSFLMNVEAALREECRARGWDIEMGIGERCWATLYPPGWPRPEQLRTTFGDTPAEALSGAVLAALEART